MISARKHKRPVAKERGASRNIGPYELIAVLGRGGMGRVYLARRSGEAGFERLSAIKVMLEHMESERDAVLMLLDEAKIASRIHHPNVVSINDIGVHQGQHYVVMDYVEGCSLSELLRRAGKIRQPRLLVPLFLDALRGLHAAHELRDNEGELLNLVHRDFSPPNLLVGVDGICRVTDFGVVKARARLTQTRASIQKGKISYMAPEQLTGTEGLDRRVDVWAAGVVMWYALTGEHPFRGESHAATIHNILDRPLLPPSSVGLKPTAAFDGLVMQALERDREKRFATAEDMADELQRIAIRHDLLATQSEVSRWINEIFVEEIQKRRSVVRAITRSGDELAWLSAPVLPHAETGSTLRQTGSQPNLTLPTDQITPLTKPIRSQPKSDRPSALRLSAALIFGVLAGFLAVTAVLFFLLRPSEEESQPPRPISTPISTPSSGPPAEDLLPRPTGAVHPEGLEQAQEQRTIDEPSLTKGPTESKEHSEPPTQEAIAIRILGLPPEARLRLDGELVSHRRWSMASDGTQHTIQIDAPGYQRWQGTFRASRSRTIRPRLSPQSSRPRSHAERRERRRRLRTLWSAVDR